jgi:hypothetical protein
MHIGQKVWKAEVEIHLGPEVKHDCCMFVVFFPGITTHCGCIFHSPVAGYSLLVFEVS